MTSLEGLDGSKFLIDPASDDELLISKFSQYPEFCAGLPFDRMSGIRYIILMYDLNNNEIQGLFPDYMTRKRECARMSGFQVEKNRFSPDVENAILGRDPTFNKMILRYVRLFNNPDYVSYVSYYEMLIKTHETALGEVDSKEISLIRANIDNLRDRINSLTSSIFRGDDSEALRKELYKTMEEERLRLRPELMAERLTKFHIEGKGFDISLDADRHKTIRRKG